VVLAAACIGTSKIYGANRLIHKESNRGIVLQNEFAKLGLSISRVEDILFVEGTGKLTSGNIHSNNDHRIAMAAGIASILTDKGIQITQPEAVAKSYPNFWEDLEINR